MNYAELREHDDTPAAPGRLDVVQRFLNLHEHVAGMTDDRPPPPEMVREYLVAAGLLEPDARYEAEDHAAAMELFDVLHGLLVAQEAGAPTAPFTRRIEDAARRASFRLRFADEPALEPALEPADGGMDGAIGHLLAILFLARLDGTWSHMKECASPTCHSVFYDRSKNHSGRWCSMRSCGNQHKVRAWRERHRADAVDA